MFSSRTSSPGVGEERAAVGGQSWWPSGPCLPTACRCALLQRAPAHPEMRIPGLSPLAPPFASKVLTFCALGARRSGASGVRSSERSPACETCRTCSSLRLLCARSQDQCSSEDACDSASITDCNHCSIPSALAAPNSCYRHCPSNRYGA